MNWIRYNVAPPRVMARDIVDSFRRDPNATTLPPGMMRADDKAWALEDAYEATAHSSLARQLKARHLQMIAIGGAIGELQCAKELGPAC